MRSALYVVGLGLRRVSRRDGGALAAALGIAAAAAVLAGILAGATVAKDRGVAQDVERLPSAARAVRAVWFGVPAGSGERWRSLDRAAREALAPLPAGEPTAVAMVRESTVAGTFVGLAAVDGLAPHVLLRSGRLPRTCRLERCEVLRLRGVGRLPDVTGLHVVQVGTASLRSGQLFGDFLAPTDNALADAALAPALREASQYHRPPPAPLVVAEGVDGLVSSPVLARSYRSYAWVQRLGGGTPRLWEIDRLVSRADTARASLEAESPSWSLTLPAQELREAEREATVAGRRLLLVGGEAAALLVAFAVLAAGAMRRDLVAARRRLTWHGARRWQTALLTATESVAVGFGGALVGWLLGAAGGALAARLAGAPVLDVLTTALLSPTGLLLALGTAVVAAAVIAATVSVDPERSRRVGPLELAALAAALVAVGILWSGAVDADELGSGGAAAAVLLLLPGLVAFAVAVAAWRLLPFVGRTAARRGWGSASRLAGVSLARAPGAAGIAVAFLALAVALAALAEAYRSTLAAGEREQAAYAVPTDVVVREDLRALVPVLQAAPLRRYRSLEGVEAVHQVTRLTASAGPAASVSGVTVLGLPAEAIRSLPLWRDEWGGTRDEVAQAIEPRTPVALRGPLLRGRDVVVEVGPGLISLRALVLRADGSLAAVEVGEADPGRAKVLRASLPRGTEGGRLLGIELVAPRLVDRGADAGVPLRGTTTLRIRGVSLDGWIGEGGVTVSNVTFDSGAKGIEYAITSQRHARFRPPQVVDTAPPQALVTPALADLAGGSGGTLPLRIGGELVEVRVADVVERLPGTTGDAVAADRGAIRAAVAIQTATAAPISELWLDVEEGSEEGVEAALESRPFAVLEKRSRADLEEDARRDPLGHGTLLALGAAALAALVLAVWGLVLAIRADLRDDRGELVDLEAQGATPSLLRRVVTARATLVAALGALAGTVGGVLLALLVTRVVSVTARAAAPEPPLVTHVEPLVVLAAIAAVAAAAGLLVLATTRRAFSEPRGPGRVGG
ncbi:MAG TPA: FtsX-like permease family protein [Gaiella sp.]|nr:FtsX-like permease family protein [Gaiella sp.]